MALAFVDQTSLAPVAISLRGGPIVRICQTHCDPVWSSGGRYLFVPEADASLTSPGRTLAIPVGPEETLPSFPASGLPSSADASTMPGATVIARGEFIPGPDVDTFAYVQTSVHRNLFRVTLP